MLELGSGGGNNASHLKKHFRMTLVDLSPGMLEVSRLLNPECEHIQGDMRTVRLRRQFDAVFIHDAIAYMTSEADLRLAVRTAFEHCLPGGVALFTPDATRETFHESSDHGGHDQPDRGLRYLDWTWDPDTSDSTYISYMVYLLREADGEGGLGRTTSANPPVRCVLDQHVLGLFSRADWLRIIQEAGFLPHYQTAEHSEAGMLEFFMGLKP
jgi:SAM-dependent methyltransferase